MLPPRADGGNNPVSPSHRSYCAANQVQLSVRRHAELSLPPTTTTPHINPRKKAGYSEHIMPPENAAVEYAQPSKKGKEREAPQPTDLVARMVALQRKQAQCVYPSFFLTLRFC